MRVRQGDRVGIRFGNRLPAESIIHCHNLEHEDAGMMRNYYIRSA